MGSGSGCVPNEPFVMLNRYKGPLCSLCIGIWTTVRCVTSGCNVRGRPIPVHSARYPLPEYSSQPTGDFSLVAEKWEPYWEVSVPKTPQGSCYFGYFCHWFVGSAPFEIT